MFGINPDVFVDLVAAGDGGEFLVLRDSVSKLRDCRVNGVSFMYSVRVFGFGCGYRDEVQSHLMLQPQSNGFDL